MNFSGISRSSSLGTLLRAPLRLLPSEMPVPVLQGPLRGAKWIIGSSNHGCWLGSYEHDKQRQFAQVLKPGQVVYDIGANVGFYTLLASRLVGNTGLVLAVEPLPRNIRYLRRHLALNRSDNVRLLEAAVAGSDDEGRLQANEKPMQARLGPDGDVEVETVRLDSLPNQGLPPPDVIKMDIEGGETDALQGGSTLLADHQPLIFLATHGGDVHRACRLLLEDLGYLVEPLDDGNPENTRELIASARKPRVGG